MARNPAPPFADPAVLRHGLGQFGQFGVVPSAPGNQLRAVIIERHHRTGQPVDCDRLCAAVDQFSGKLKRSTRQQFDPLVQFDPGVLIGQYDLDCSGIRSYLR